MEDRNFKVNTSNEGIFEQDKINMKEKNKYVMNPAQIMLKVKNRKIKQKMNKIVKTKYLNKL